MSKINFLVAGALLIIAVAVMCLDSEEETKRYKILYSRFPYPYIECHFPVRSPQPESRVSNAKLWKECKRNETESGTCAKTCVLRNYTALYRLDDNPQNPIVFDVEAFVKIVFDQTDLHRRDAERTSHSRIRQEMKSCQAKFPDINQLNISSSCEPWKEVLHCINGAYGCRKGWASKQVGNV